MMLLKFFHVFFALIWMGSLVVLSFILTDKQRAFPTTLFNRIYFLFDLPSMILTILMGFSLFVCKDLTWKAPWFHMKLLFVFFLVGLDFGVRQWFIHRKSVLGGWILHGSILVSLAGVLSAIYILKPYFAG